MKNIVVVLLTLFSFHCLLGQDGISPITVNPELFSQEGTITNKALGNSLDSTVIYLTDTLVLPFFDDFSRNKFQQYTTQVGDPNLGEELYFRMIDENTSVPLDAGATFTSQRTYRAIYDPVQEETTYDYFDSTRFKFDDLSSYPLDYIPTYAYPPYKIYDTIGGGAEDTVWLAAKEIDFTQDSIRIFVDTIQNSNKLWLNSEAYHNYRFAKNPWSLGVVTFDGLNANGYPYNFGSTIAAVADTLLSKPIDMSVHSAADSIYFTFLYQKQGWGDPPEKFDSLFLDFYNPTTKMWKRVWRTNGGATSDFKKAQIALTNPGYFANGFQFRFMNFGSLAGGLDNFHIDYVNLRAFSGYQDVIIKDFAVVYPIHTLLKDYTSVPWKHFRNHPNGKMSDAVEFTVRNSSVLTQNNQNGKVDIYHKGVLEGSFVLNASKLSGGNINYAPTSTYTSFHDFSTGYVFDHTLPNDTMAIFDYQGIATAQFPNYPLNDTTFGKQIFRNYYAYDDGTAEKAYGVTGEQGLLAYKFNMYQPDSLIAIQIYFVPSVVDVSNNLFYITIWEDENGHPGDKIYEDKILNPRQPMYTHSTNKFYTYFFKDTMKIGVGKTFYVGMRQVGQDRLNIGLDMNNDNADKIFWSVDAGATWKNAGYSGSMMIRPIVTTKMNYLLGIKENHLAQQDYSFTIYPNPSHSTINIKVHENRENNIFIIRDLNGRVVKRILTTKNIPIYNLQKGIYLISRIENHRSVQTQKLVVQ